MGNSSLNASPEKGGEREMSYWNCEGPLTPTHQCEEVENLHSEFNYSHEGKYCDERGVRYNSDSDASDIASRCPECPKCSMERHTALKKRGKLPYHKYILFMQVSIFF